MAEKQESSLEAMTSMSRAMKYCIGRCESDLRMATEFFDGNFKGLDIKQLPEYQKAVDAIRAYQEASANHFEEKWKEQDSGSEPARK